MAAIRGGRSLFGGLEFSVPAGGALVLAGPNGSGKTSLLRLMAGFGRPSAGRFDWDGADIADDPEAHRVRLHYVGHQDALKPALTAGETLRFWQALAGHSDGDGSAALAECGLAELEHVPCRFLSAGQRRRLALARLAAWKAPLWLLDEPAVGLDVAALAALADRIRQHRAAGGMVVLSTHQPIELDDALRLSLDDFPPAPADMLADLDDW